MRSYAIGIDLGGTSVKYALVASDGGVLFSGKLPTLADEGAEAVLGQILAGAKSCLEFAAENGLQPVGIGVGSPGVVSADERMVLGGAENIPGWERIPISDRLEQATGLPVRVNNDANLMALGETLYGAAKGATDVVFLTVGTGIGGGVLIDGRLYGGYRNRGTEFGHMTVKCDGEPCACGSVGCLEHYASTAALVRRFQARCAEEKRACTRCDGEMIVALYHAGDALAREVMEEHWDYLSTGIISIIHIFSPQTVVIGGGISEAGEFYLDELRKRVFARAMAVCSEETRIVGATLGNRAGCLGAAGLAFRPTEKKS
ncbi:ROK family protein [uncultured Alistipes sp.]|uniref:ROK family protein n=1 Tax=uncultured Alistipes sp. TaxID=538949 RepID=UPI002601E8DB|nr:ROK family protein [uncultured Alistipes sp.]